MPTLTSDLPVQHEGLQKENFLRSLDVFESRIRGSSIFWLQAEHVFNNNKTPK